mmetsp:Transcript_65/g.231  ORF Transcript_65/g.231 Transcript_65/m.231 type:complete len:396 (-) Transcript_65:41-1228(-)
MPSDPRPSTVATGTVGSKVQLGRRSGSRGRTSARGCGPAVEASHRASSSLGQAGQEKQERQLRFKSVQTRFLTNVCKHERLAAVGLFRLCSAEFVEMLAEQVSTQVFDADVVVFRQGEPGDRMYIVIHGEVQVMVGETIVGILSNGAVFGEMAVISKNAAAAKRTATVRTKTVCHCYVVDRLSLVCTLGRFPADDLIIRDEAQRRLAELQAKGVLPKPPKWWSLTPKESEAAERVNIRRRARARWRRAGFLSRRVRPCALAESQWAYRSPDSSSASSFAQESPRTNKVVSSVPDLVESSPEPDTGRDLQAEAVPTPGLPGPMRKNLRAGPSRLQTARLLRPTVASRRWDSAGMSLQAWLHFGDVLKGHEKPVRCISIANKAAGSKQPRQIFLRPS